MELGTCLIAYLIVTIIFILIFIKICIRPWSAIILGLLLGFIILNIICPPSCLDPWKHSTSLFAVYLLIEIGTIVLLLIYVFMAAWRDREVPQMRIEVTGTGQRQSTTIYGTVAEGICSDGGCVRPSSPICSTSNLCSTSNVCPANPELPKICATIPGQGTVCIKNSPCFPKRVARKKC